MMNRNWAGLFFLSVALPWMAHANFSGGDDFNDNSVDAAKWGADEVRNYGTFTEINQRLEYTAYMPVGPLGMVFHHWTSNYGSYTEDWTVQADVNMASLALGSSDVMFLSLTAANVANYNYNQGGLTLRERSTGFTIAAGIQNASNQTSETTVAVTSGSVSLQIRFDSATHTLIESYDADGLIGGYQWTEAATYDVTSWGMGDSSQFQLELVAGGTMYSTSQTITSGQVYADNLSTTPEPSAWLLLLAGFIAIAANNRRRFAGI